MLAARQKTVSHAAAAPPRLSGTRGRTAHSALGKSSPTANPEPGPPRVAHSETQGLWNPCVKCSLERPLQSCNDPKAVTEPRREWPRPIIAPAVPEQGLAAKRLVVTGPGRPEMHRAVCPRHHGKLPEPPQGCCSTRNGRGTRV